MGYNLLICVTKKRWIAMDISPDGKCDRVSFDGNDAITVESPENVADLYSKILDYYNISKFSDIEVNIKVVMISDYSNMVSELFSYVKDAKSVSIIDVKDVIPIYVLKNCIIKPCSVIDVSCMNEKFTLYVNEELVVSYIMDRVGEEIQILPEEFSLLFTFDCKKLISDESELKRVAEKFSTEVDIKQKEIDKQKKKYTKLKKEYDELEACYIKLQNEVEESKTKFEEKRTILRFDESLLPSNQIIETIHSLLNNEEILCHFERKDGEIVDKGIELVTFDNNFHTRSYTMKANAKGRIFFLVKDGTKMRNNEAVALLSDVADTRTNVMKWYEEMK